jgi:hypothetical protein
MEWVKLSHGFIRDEKMHFITKRYGHDAGLFWPVLLSEVDDSGVLQMDMEIFSEIIMVEPQRLNEIVSIYLRHGLVTKCNASQGDETIKVTHWEKYQYSESYLRVKKFREKQKSKNVTPSNADETEVKRSCNGLVTTDPDPDPDPDKEYISTYVDIVDKVVDPPPALAKKANGHCPTQAIIDLYHKILPDLPEVRAWNYRRKIWLRARWREHPTLEWWEEYFEHVAESDFLRGRSKPKNGDMPFLASLEWLINPAHFANVIEGKYHG